jgi:hypothetical protein
VVVPGGQGRQEVDPSTQLQFNLGLEPIAGLSLSVYGLGALKETQAASNMGLLNQEALYSSRRELGLQAGYRF